MTNCRFGLTFQNLLDGGHGAPLIRPSRVRAKTNHTRSVNKEAARQKASSYQSRESYCTLHLRGSIFKRSHGICTYSICWHVSSQKARMDVVTSYFVLGPACNGHRRLRHLGRADGVSHSPSYHLAAPTLDSEVDFWFCFGRLRFYSELWPPDRVFGSRPCDVSPRHGLQSSIFDFHHLLSCVRILYMKSCEVIPTLRTTLPCTLLLQRNNCFC